MSSADPALIAALVKARSAPFFATQTRQQACHIAHAAITLLFPQFADQVSSKPEEIEQEILALHQGLVTFLELIAQRYPEPASRKTALADEFIGQLAAIQALLTEDAEAIFHADPAADSIDEIILSYPGFLATAYYRLAHRLHQIGVPLLPRLISQEAHHQTGVDINPGAVIGRRFSIDHGTGVVIGETAIIGHGVKLYQGVTLGALAVDRLLRNTKRHPTIEDNVVIYANATILGGDTVIGHDTIVGGNAWLTRSVPPFSLVNRQNVIKPRTDSGEEMIDFMI